MYVLTYRNAEYDYIIDLQNIIFYGGEQDLNTLYNFLANADDDFKKIKIGDNDIRVKKLKKYIMVTVYPDNDIDGYFILSPKHLKKLFGKA
jgi:hypothetical protein